MRDSAERQRQMEFRQLQPLSVENWAKVEKALATLEAVGLKVRLSDTLRQELRNEPPGWWEVVITPTATLPRLNLENADLRGRELPKDLIGARLRKANLQGCTLDVLHAADLRGADLRGAKFVPGACLSYASLQGADLRETDLSAVEVVAALFNEETKWPPGYDAAQFGAQMVR